MLLETLFWIIGLGFITYKYDIMLLDSINKMSDNHHFIIISCFMICCLYILSRTLFPFRKKELNESFIWIIFIKTMSLSCRNQLGGDIDTFHFLYFSLMVLYLIYIYRLIHPKEETLVIQKIIIVSLVVLKIFWPTIVYLWPYGADYPDDFDWTDWPYISF